MAAFKSSSSPASSPKGQQTPAQKPPAPPAKTATTVEVFGVIAYPCLTAPDEKSGKYNCLFYITDPEIQQTLVDLVGDAAEAMFRVRELPAGYNDPLRDANEKSHDGEFAFKHPAFREGGMVCRLKTGFDPKCVWGPNETEIDASEINGGDECVIEVNAYAYDNQSRGVGLSMGRIWLINKGKVKIERGSGGGNVQRLDRSKLRFAQFEGSGDEAA